MTELQRRIDFCLRNPHMWNHCDDVKKALAEAGDVLHNLHGQIRDYDRQQKERDAALAERDAEIAELRERLEHFDKLVLIDHGPEIAGLKKQIADLRRALEMCNDKRKERCLSREYDWTPEHWINQAREGEGEDAMETPQGDSGKCLMCSQPLDAAAEITEERKRADVAEVRWGKWRHTAGVFQKERDEYAAMLLLAVKQYLPELGPLDQSQYIDHLRDMVAISEKAKEEAKARDGEGETDDANP